MAEFVREHARNLVRDFALSAAARRADRPCRPAARSRSGRSRTTPPPRATCRCRRRSRSLSHHRGERGLSLRPVADFSVRRRARTCWSTASPIRSPRTTERSAPDDRQAAECRTPSQGQWSTPPPATSRRSARSAGPLHIQRAAPRQKLFRDGLVFDVETRQRRGRDAADAAIHADRRAADIVIRPGGDHRAVFDDLELLREVAA